VAALNRRMDASDLERGKFVAHFAYFDAQVRQLWYY